jgi:hypothetical protein
VRTSREATAGCCGHTWMPQSAGAAGVRALRCRVPQGGSGTEGGGGDVECRVAQGGHDEVTKGGRWLSFGRGRCMRDSSGERRIWRVQPEYRCRFSCVTHKGGTINARDHTLRKPRRPPRHIPRFPHANSPLSRRRPTRHRRTARSKHAAIAANRPPPPHAHSHCRDTHADCPYSSVCAAASTPGTRHGWRSAMPPTSPTAQPRSSRAARIRARPCGRVRASPREVANAAATRVDRPVGARSQRWLSVCDRGSASSGHRHNRAP